MTIPGISTDGQGESLQPLPAQTALGNFTNSTAQPIAENVDVWRTWLGIGDIDGGEPDSDFLIDIDGGTP